jgi:glycosyltransferase involved in cell wall biosynthesis
MIKRLCYISRNYRTIENSGNKAKTDNEHTLKELKAHNLGLPTTYYNSKIMTFLLDLAGIIKMMFTVRRGDVIVLQYPVKKYFSFICDCAHLHHAKVVALIHDLGSMRRKKLTVEKEISRLMHADYVIASNDTMAEWLADHGYSKGLGALGLFDYRSESVSREHHTDYSQYSLVYAGALAMRKNSFLLKMQDMIEGYQLNIYGNKNGLPGLMDSDRIHVNGFMKSEDFIAGVAGDFGFVWDGDSLSTCSGSFGEYLRWNSPHKVSFYLRAGLPIIVWDQAAIAPIVKKEAIGICISDISELSHVLKSVTPEKMYKMKINVNRVSKDLSKGEFLKKAVTKSLISLDE